MPEQNIEVGKKSLRDQRIEWGSWFSILCTMAGTGILQLPYTLLQGGWLCLVLIVLIGWMTNTTGRWIVRCLYDHSRVGLLQPQNRLQGYPEVGEAAYGKYGRYIVQIFHKATLVGVTTIFLILAGKFLLEGIGGGGEGFLADSIGSSSPVDISKWTKIWTIVSASLLLFPVALIPTMGEIAPLAAFGLLATGFVVLEIIAFAFIFGPVTDATVENYHLPLPDKFTNATNPDFFMHSDTSVSYKVFYLRNFPTAFAAITLSFGGHAVFPTIEKHMKTPENFEKTFNAAYLSLVAVYITAAVAGYYTFGNITFTPILCNFPRDTSTALGAITATTKLMIAFHVMSAYPILMNVVVTEMEQTMGISHTRRDDDVLSKRACKRLMLRTGMVVLTCFVAVMVPFFGPVMEFVGAVCLTMIVFVLPVVFSYKLRGDSMTFAEKIWGVCIIFAGLVGGTIGGIQSIISIVDLLKAGAIQ
eukprot:g396.t1